MASKKTNHNKQLLTILITLTILIGIGFLLKPLIIESYCENQAKKIVENEWGKLFKAEGYELNYVEQITWGFREQLKCERKF